MDNLTSFWFNTSSTHSIDTTTVAFASGAMRIYFYPEKVYDKLMLLWPILWLFILPPGLVANALNMRTFFRMGLTDSVTISFFTLAVTDFAQLFFPLAGVVAMTLVYVEKNFSVLFKIQPLIVFFYGINSAALFNMWTCLITAFLSVQRCLCIFMPFHFRSIFTNFRTWFAMGVFGVYSSLPIINFLFLAYELRPMTLSNNRTQIILGIKSSIGTFQMFADYFYMTTSVTCQVLSLGSIIIMGFTLASSVRFRKKATSSTSSTGKQKQARIAKRAEEVKDQSTGQEDEEKSSSKERTAIIQVALLSTIYLVTSLPRIAFSVVSITIPEFGPNKKWNNLFLVCNILRLTFDYINSAVNILVYYRYNSRFRQLCFATSSKEGTLKTK